MSSAESFVDIHCHLLPGIDDGAQNLDKSLAMARLAVADGIETIIATPHQLGGYAHNDGPMIRRAVDDLTRALDEQQIPLRVLPGADVRIERDLVARLRRGDVVSLADTGRFVLLELPHEMYQPLDPLLEELAAIGCQGILSHPERNHGILVSPEVLRPLVDQGCLMQITAGSLLGQFGARSRMLCEQMLDEHLVHFVASDAHGTRSRPPLLSGAYECVAARSGHEVARAVCCTNPAAVAAGEAIEVLSTGPARSHGGWRAWLGLRKVA